MSGDGQTPVSPATIVPTPTEEEAAAITAALTLAWPRPAAPVEELDQPDRWRFSGRWWGRRSTWGEPTTR